MTLGVILNRRLMAVVGVQEEQVVLADSRFVRAGRSGASDGVTHYFATILEQSKPEAIYLCAPDDAGLVSQALVKALDQEAGQVGVPVKRLSRGEVLSSFGILPVRTRRLLQSVIAPLWSGLNDHKRNRQGVIAEAAATALVGDFNQEWPVT